MSSEGEVTATGYMSSIAEIALREQGRLDGEIERLSTEMDSVKAEKRKVDAVLKTLNGSVGRSGTKPRVRKATQKISEAKRQAFMDYATGNPDEITSATVRERLGVSGSYASIICTQMREEGYLRLAATHGSLMVYRSTV